MESIVAKNAKTEVLLAGFRIVFEKLHQSVTGSRKIVELGNLSIYEEDLPDRGRVNFYFFHGTTEDQEKYFPEQNESYCTFYDSSVTISALVKGVQEEFPCAFGYILHRKELEEEFRLSDGRKKAILWMAIQIWSHEIRHEIQLFHGLTFSQLRAAFPQTGASSKISSEHWNEFKKRLETLYQGYVRKRRESGYLCRERDAIITSYLSLVEWHRADLDDEARMRRVVEVILDGP